MTEPEPLSLAAIVSGLLARNVCTRCGNSLGEEGTGRFRSIGWPNPADVFCEYCYSEAMEEWSLNESREYWAERERLERECDD